jgi:hypothetical protein
MQTVRTITRLDKTLLAEALGAHPGWSHTAVIEEGLRALLARAASERLAALGGKAKTARRPRRSAWKRS